MTRAPWLRHLFLLFALAPTYYAVASLLSTAACGTNQSPPGALEGEGNVNSTSSGSHPDASVTGDDAAATSATSTPGASADAETTDGEPSDAGTGAPAPPPGAIFIPPTPQPTCTTDQISQGYTYLVNGPYISQGIPWDGFQANMSPLLPTDTIPGRQGQNATVGYDFNVSPNMVDGSPAQGMTIASPNCLACHATHLQGQLVIGLGRPNHGIATDVSGTNLSIPNILLSLKTPAETNEFETFGLRLIQSVSSGEMLVFAALASHRDPATLAWQDNPGFDAGTSLAGWVDIAPWWRVKKKNGLYYQGMGRGLQSRHMSFMSVFSVYDVTEATEIETNFVNVGCYLRSLTAPAYPQATDSTLVSRGEQVFNNTCATCHGTYGPNGSYPNLLIPYAMVGTDPSLATQGWINQAAAQWFKDSFYAGGSESWLDPEPGYVAPPLDGIWTTAPFFHNGSVPTLEGVLDSTQRPAQWTSQFGDTDYDLTHVGWNNTPLQGDLYDTTQPGYSNAGHTYGDALSTDDRAAVLEYLKTL